MRMRFIFMLLVLCSFASDSFATENTLKKAIIFDLDGTVVDSEPFWFGLHIHMLEQRSHVLDDPARLELYKAMHGKSSHQITKWIKERYELPESVEDLVNEYDRCSEEQCNGQITLVPGFDEFFKKVAAMKIKTAIATNCGSHSMGLIDKSVDLKNKFGRFLYNRDHVRAGKPAPDIYLLAARELGVIPEECIAIEDSATGIASAQAAGMFCIGLGRGDHHPVESANLVVEGYEEIDLKSFNWDLQ